MRLVHSTRGRTFEADIPSRSLKNLQSATLKTRYKGRRFCKNAFDIVLYLKLLEKLKPRTIIEIGTSEGGSAVWFLDQCRAMGFDTRILTFDITPATDLPDDIFSGKVDANHPGEYLSAEFFSAHAHPWLIIEDSAHTYEATIGILRYFNQLTLPGDYVVVEDGIVADMPGEQYAKYEDGPNRAVKEFLSETADKYDIDTELCDFFGHNATYCPNGWLKVNNR